MKKIEYIEEIVKNSGSISTALEDLVTSRPAILMHLTAIAEQFNKLKLSHCDEILNEFDNLWKESFEVNEDFLIETILVRAFETGRLQNQPPATPVNYDDLNEAWHIKASQLK